METKYSLLLVVQLLLTGGHKFTEVFFAKALAKLWLKIQPGIFFSLVHWLWFITEQCSHTIITIADLLLDYILLIQIIKNLQV